MNLKQLVWYASYGSNMDANRFNCYIAGGIPVGGHRKYIGCNDKTPPISDTAIDIPGSIYFAGESTVWNGGMAFLNINDIKHVAKGRAYLINLGQFEQIIAQEDGLQKPISIDIEELCKKHQNTINEIRGNYNELVYSGELDGYPVITFTSSQIKTTYTRPSEVYLRKIGQGIMASHKISLNNTVEYLLKVPGVSGQYTAYELINILK